jgi:hypothetical protein
LARFLNLDKQSAIAPFRAGGAAMPRVPLLLLLAALAAAPAFAQPLERDSNRPGNDYTSTDLPAPDPALCARACEQDARCRAFTYIAPGIQGPAARCWLKDGVPAAHPDRCCVSGVKGAPAAGLEQDTDRPGANLRHFDLPATDPELCRAECQRDPACGAFTYVHPGVQGPRARCYLKSGAPAAVASRCCVSGLRGAPAAKTEEAPARAPAAAPVVVMQPTLAVAVLPVVDPSMRAGTDMPGGDYRSLDLPESEPVPHACEAACRRDPRCQAWTWLQPGVQGPNARCWLKSESRKPVANAACVSGELGPRHGTVTGPASPPAAKAVLPAQEMRDQLAHFDRRWRGLVERRLPEGPVALVRTQDLAVRQENQRLRAKLSGPAALQAAAAPPAPIGKLAQVKRVAPIVPTASWQATPGAIRDGTVWDGRYVLIAGKGFGACGGKCSVRLEYEEQVQQGEVFTPGYKAPRHAVELEPALGSWESAWQDELIVARVPLLREPSLATKAHLVLRRDAAPAMALAQPVDLVLSGPGLWYLDTVPNTGDGRITAGGEIVVRGAGFGATPGQIRLEVPGLPGAAPALHVVTWQDHAIHVRVPRVPGLVEVHSARVHVKSGEPPGREAFVGTSFGPRMLITQVSGAEFLEFSKGDEEKDGFEEQSGVLYATHDPGCGNIGNAGDDWFFRNRPLPAGVAVAGAYFVQVAPNDTDASLDFLLDEIQSWAEALGQYGPVGVLKKWCEYLFLAIASWIDPNVGSYRLREIEKASKESPVFGLHWENTCVGPYDGVPIKYLATFYLSGPEEVVPGTPVGYVGGGTTLR